MLLQVLLQRLARLELRKLVDVQIHVKPVCCLRQLLEPALGWVGHRERVDS